MVWTMNSRQDSSHSPVFLAINDGRVVRAACDEHGSWAVETVLAGLAAVTLAADPGHPDTVYAGTQGNGIYRSDDRGRSWAQLGLAGQIVKSIAVSPHDPRVVYAGCLLYTSRCV